MSVEIWLTLAVNMAFFSAIAFVASSPSGNLKTVIGMSASHGLAHFLYFSGWLYPSAAIVPFLVTIVQWLDFMAHRQWRADSAPQSAADAAFFADARRQMNRRGPDR